MLQCLLLLPHFSLLIYHYSLLTPQSVPAQYSVITPRFSLFIIHCSPHTPLSSFLSIYCSLQTSHLLQRLLLIRHCLILFTLHWLLLTAYSNFSIFSAHKIFFNVHFSRIIPHSSLLISCFYLLIIRETVF